MVCRIRRSFIQHTDGFLVQLHEIPLERQICNPRLILVSLTPIILKEQRKTPRAVEVHPLHGYLLDLIRLANLKGLCGLLLGRGLKIHVIPEVCKDLESFWTGR